jgi:hypothetical protein
MSIANNILLGPDPDTECLICLDGNNMIKLSIIKSYYWTSCDCDIYIHEKCFMAWIKIKDSCPLCRAVYYSKMKYSKAIARGFATQFTSRFVSFLNLIIIYMIFAYLVIQFTEIIIRDSIYHD